MQGVTQHVSSRQAHTVFEIIHRGRSYVFSERDLDAFGNPIGVELPSHVVVQVASSEPGVKGDTASGATKPATIATGATINVPLFINEGEWIKVDTRTGDYLERVNRR